MLTLNNLKSPKGAHKNTKRIGRGQGSGQGTQAGKGHKGQKARKSGHVRTGFEGGSMPLYMRLPKRGFSNAVHKEEYATITLGQIAAKFDSEVVSRETLCEKGLLKGQDRHRSIKILASGELAKALTFVNIDKFTKGAEEAITKNGGKIETK
ncbi:ribosomal protein L15 [Bacteriovorax sp. BSW11_IV]|uniref:50S ribosomal protein L15 n=1 Tax=Bacteriovorax sp. BSW11_IV TaxID=1353529 RepID=UPI000389FC99|nr:50S ribosomal protein L15 [Bacteriovorax sp. BSW11_IV]EQC48835.1 ribosomal protein L15 [Bacteriovorax sp. BSW11_IV]